MNGVWAQNYDPLGSFPLSVAAAAAPVCLLCYLLAFRRTAAWRAAVAAGLTGAGIAVGIFGAPAAVVAGAVASAVVFGIIRVVLTLLAAVFVYEIAVESGRFKVLTESIAGLTGDARIQGVLIAFAFSALLEGSGGGGAPVAIAAGMLAGIGFKPFQAAVLALIGNTVPVAWGAMGNPIRTLAAVTGLSEGSLSATAGRILPAAAFVLPFWMVWVQCGRRRAFEVWRPLLTAGVAFAALVAVWSNFMDMALVAIVAGLGTLGALWLAVRGQRSTPHPPRAVLLAWSPFLLLVLFVVVWGLPGIRGVLDATTWKVPVPGLHLVVLRQPPVVAAPRPEPAVFEFAWLASSGTAAILSGVVAGPLLGLSVRRTFHVLGRTTWRIRTSVVAILAMLSLGFLTRYSGMDAVLGLALTHTGPLFPFFGTLLGWMGVLLTGTNAGSNALFGSLQTITARNLGLPPVLMASANAAGGVMGKMVNAQSLVIGCTAAGLEGKEGELFRAVFKHSVALALLLGAVVTVFAYAVPGWVPAE